MTQDIADKPSVLFGGLSGFWQAFFKDAPDLEAYYQAAEVYLGQVYLDLMSVILNIGAVDTTIFNKEYWKLFTVLETELNFQAGATVDDDRYVYDMPGDTVSINFLQNTIISPTVLLERGVEFEVEDDDGFIRFQDDPFRDYQDNNGEWQPMPGVAWRTVPRSVGNTLASTAQTLYGVPQHHTAYDDGVRRGDTLRLLAQRGAEITSGLTGSILKIPAGFMFFGTGVEQASVGDVVEVYGHDGGVGHVDDAYREFYVVKKVFTDPPVPNQVELEPLSVYNSAPAGSTSNLYWRLYSAIYFETFRDYEVDYIAGIGLVGSSDNPYPLDLEGLPVYSVVRTPASPDVLGADMNYATDETFPPDPAGLPYTPPYSPSNPPPEYITDLGYRHLVPGSVVVYAKKWKSDTEEVGAEVVEGVDYTVDYLNGKIYQKTYWLPASRGECDFQYKTEVYLSGSGDISSLSVGNIKQLSYWVPEVAVDRFTLWYNYGSMLNRFEASSEAYKAFLLGIMYLYVTGPILQRIEAALNVAAELPVIGTDGEVLQDYDDGEIASGTTAAITAATSGVAIDTGEYVLGEIDVGGYIIFPSPLNAANKGEFRILEVYSATNSALLETVFDLVDEDPVDWVISHTYQKIVTTDQRSYEYPYYVPMREDVEDPANFGILTFVAFEPLTLGFTVTDYMEDPTWWHDKQIPPILWPQTPHTSSSLVRRRAATKLFEHVVGAEDLAAVGDPELYIGADSEGTVLSPNDNTGGPGVGDPVSLHRHGTAFVLFDKYLKLHMFYIAISPDLRLDSDFQDDLEELILVAKPSYTYPNVDVGNVYIDNVVLTDDFTIPHIIFDFDELGQPDSLHLANNELIIGDVNFPWSIGDFYRYEEPATAMPGGPYPDPIPPGTIFDVQSFLTTGRRPVNLNILSVTRTSDGKVPIEGRDYSVNWLVEDPPGTLNPHRWKIMTFTEWDNSGAGISISFQTYQEVAPGVYDTRLGDTPLFISGLNPWYIRHTALDPTLLSYMIEWAALRSEYIDRALRLEIFDGGASYTYP